MYPLPHDLTPVVHRITRALRLITEETHLVVARPGSMNWISEDGSNRYVQFAMFGPNLRAESVGDRYLVGGDRITADQRAALGALGWSEPDEGGNYWRHWTPADPYHAARLAVRTLHHVHGVVSAEQLTFDAVDPPMIDVLADPEPVAPRWFGYYDFDRNEMLDCWRCSWTGVAGEIAERSGEFLDVECGDCGQRLMTVVFPTLDDTRRAAADGHPQAIRDLPDFEAQAAWRQRASDSHLRSGDQLPDLVGDHLVIEWDIGGGEGGEGGSWQILRHDGVEIWREIAYYESYERYGEIVEILRQRYGNRLRDVRDNERSAVWLYGDRLGSLGHVQAIQRTLLEQNRAAHGDPPPER